MKTLYNKLNFRLEPMDIIFPKNRKDWISKIIRYVTKGDTSHSEIVIAQDGATLSANFGKGVHIDHIFRYVVNRQDFDIYRYDGKSELDMLKFNRLVKEYEGKGYDTFGSFGSANQWYLNWFPQNKNKLFCSEITSKFILSLYPEIVLGDKPSEINPEELENLIVKNFKLVYKHRN